VVCSSHGVLTAAVTAKRPAGQLLWQYMCIWAPEQSRTVRGYISIQASDSARARGRSHQARTRRSTVTYQKYHLILVI
jgi:hypothetical protein